VNEKTSAVQTAAIITGKVTDAVTQQGMAGVNVVIKGATVGTTTDADGKFSLQADNKDILVFSFIGYTTFETQVNGRIVFDVVLQEDIKSLNEVVVNAGYWEVKEKEQTGNISKVTAEEISKQPVSNPLQALQGRMAGVYIQQSSGVPGSNFTVRIRGQNSIQSGNDPLYIIDGVPYLSGTLSNNITALSILGSGGVSPLNSIDPNEIESIEALKDADATAIYGSRGANGVILITTKKGKQGKTQLDFNVYLGASTVSRKMDLLDTQQYIEMRNEALENDGQVPGEWDHDVNGNWDQNRYTDWQETLIGGTAHITNAQLSISGGDKNSQFLFSGSYQKQGTVFPGDFNINKFSSHFSFGHTSTDKKFKASFSFNYVLNKSNLLNNDLTGLSLQLAPDAPALYDEQGKLNWENSTWENPLSYLETSYKENTNNLIANTVLGYEILPGVEFKTSFGINKISTTEKNITPSTFYNPAWNPTPQWGSLYLNTGNVQSLIIEPQLNWEKEMGKGKLSTILGATYQQRITDQLLQDAYGFTSDALIEDIDAAGTIEIREYINAQYKYNAAFCRINYNWDGKYIVNATARRDGSSRFGPGKQFGNFGAIGAAWIFSKERFIEEGLTFISFGKLRTSYGTSGNDQIGDYQYLDTYTSGTAYQGVNGLRPTRLFNPDFSWEINKKLEIAIEFGFLDDRILFSTSYYLNRSSNQLVNYPLARTTGFTGIQSNLAARVENKGLEFELTTINLNKGSLTWTTSLNITIPTNELIAFPDLENSSYASSYVVGEPLTILKMFHYLGVNPETGFYQFSDMNGDGTVSSEDQLAIVKRALDYYGGVNNSISYNGLQLDVFFQFVKQTGGNYWGSASSAPGQFNANQPVEVLNNRWQNPGDEAVLQRYTATFDPSFNMYSRSDASTNDASFIRLKNVFLSYQFPEKWTKDVKCRLFVQGQNLLTITNYFGMDPESTNSFILPPLRTFTVGLRATL